MKSINFNPFTKQLDELLEEYDNGMPSPELQKEMLDYLEIKECHAGKGIKFIIRFTKALRRWYLSDWKSLDRHLEAIMQLEEEGLKRARQLLSKTDDRGDTTLGFLYKDAAVMANALCAKTGAHAWTEKALEYSLESARLLEKSNKPEAASHSYTCAAISAEAVSFLTGNPMYLFKAADYNEKAARLYAEHKKEYAAEQFYIAQEHWTKLNKLTKEKVFAEKAINCLTEAEKYLEFSQKKERLSAQIESQKTYITEVLKNRHNAKPL